MAKLGKWITAAGGVLVAVFSLVAIIMAATAGEKFGGRTIGGLSTGQTVNAVFQGIVMIALGGAVAAGAVLMYDKLAKSLCWVAATAAFLASDLVSSPLQVGGMNFWIIMGALVAIVGANWNCCCGEVSEAVGGDKPAATPTAPAAPAQQPPESRL